MRLGVGGSCVETRGRSPDGSKCDSRESVGVIGRDGCLKIDPDVSVVCDALPYRTVRRLVPTDDEMMQLQLPVAAYSFAVVGRRKGEVGEVWVYVLFDCTASSSSVNGGRFREAGTEIQLRRRLTTNIRFFELSRAAQPDPAARCKPD